MRRALLAFLIAVAASAATIVDVQKVPLAGDPASALVRIVIPERIEEVASVVRLGVAL